MVNGAVIITMTAFKIQTRARQDMDVGYTQEMQGEILQYCVREINITKSKTCLITKWEKQFQPDWWIEKIKKLELEQTK